MLYDILNLENTGFGFFQNQDQQNKIKASLCGLESEDSTFQHWLTRGVGSNSILTYVRSDELTKQYHHIKC